MKERMNIVIVGHVDHGKSTLIGRLLADTGALPQGKLEQIKNLCERNSKPFEYAFLLDALKDEQSQGITIDTARIFFKSQKRDYIIIDAPGHIEFLKNMISGAARAEAALLLIDAHEGIAENSKRHAYMLSLLGIKQIAVVVNKMDLVGYSKSVFESVKENFTKHLHQVGIEPVAYIPTSAREGVNLNEHSELTPWYTGATLLEILDSFDKQKPSDEKRFRMFLQGIYKFAGHNNERRIFAGTINSGKISVGDEITFLPSGKKSTVRSIESFNTPVKQTAKAGEPVGFTLTEEVYVQPTELMFKEPEGTPKFADRFRVNIFWMGKNALSLNKKYKLKIGTQSVKAEIEEIEHVLNTAELQSFDKPLQVLRNEVAQCIIRTEKPVPFDLVGQDESTSRFVLVDYYDIAGGGIITSAVDGQNTSSGKVRIPEFEVALYKLIREHFPHWQLAPLEEEQ